eukprot:1307133-Amphidinium_carterae.1
MYAKVALFMRTIRDLSFHKLLSNDVFTSLTCGQATCSNAFPMLRTVKFTNFGSCHYSECLTSSCRCNFHDAGQWSHSSFGCKTWVKHTQLCDSWSKLLHQRDSNYASL